MTKITRKELLKGGMAAAAAVAALPFAHPMALAANGGDKALVHAHGTVRLTKAGAGLPAGTAVDISVDATGQKEGAGSTDPLSGAGWDSFKFDSPDVVSTVCYYSQRGALLDDSFHVHGVVFFSNIPAFLGARVTTDANLETGEITWTFGPGPAFPDTLVFIGTGVVVKVD